MSDLLANPAIQSGALPFVVALFVAAVLGYSGSTTRRYAGLAVAAGFLAAYAITFGLPPLPPNTSGQKIAYIAVLAALAGSLLDGWRATGGRRLALGLGVAVVSTVWIGWRKIIAPPSFEHLSVLLLLAGAAVALFATQKESEDGADKTVPLMVISLAMAGIAFIGASASISQNAGAMGAALGGLLILNWPKRRFGLSATARLVPLIILIALGAQIVFFTKAPAWVLALLLPSLFADRLAERWISTDNRQTALRRPVLVTLIAAVPAAVALAAAWFSAPSSDLSGGY